MLPESLAKAMNSSKMCLKTTIVSKRFKIRSEMERGHANLMMNTILKGTAQEF